MSPKFFEGFFPHVPDATQEHEKIAEKNEKVEQLSPQIDYAVAQQIWFEHLDKIEEGNALEEYEYSDKDLGINMLGDSNGAFVSIGRESPMAVILEKKLFALGYQKTDNEQKRNIIFSKIFSRTNEVSPFREF